MTTGTAIGASLSVPGRPDQVHAARVFTSEALGDDHPCALVAVLLVSELVTNSVLHSDSRLPGGTVTLTVTGTADLARVEVRDAGGTSVPSLKGQVTWRRRAVTVSGWSITWRPGGITAAMRPGSSPGSRSARSRHHDRSTQARQAGQPGCPVNWATTSTAGSSAAPPRS